MRNEGRFVSSVGVDRQGLSGTGTVYWNLSPARLSEAAVLRGEAKLASAGPLVCLTGSQTGRSPQDKYVVGDAATDGEIWWGEVNRRFERERDILAALSHPRIAHLYDAGVDAAQNPYLAMEWVDGIAINEYCRNAKVSLERRLNLFLQVLDAVGHAHGRLIAHRDLKPSNILVTPEERVKLLDFGIAKLLDGDAQRGATQMTRVGACIATPAYAAPEQLAGEPITAAVDLYALGVILHEMLTGQRPFRDNRKTSAERTDAFIAVGG